MITTREIAIPALLAIIGGLLFWLPEESELSKAYAVNEFRRRAGMSRDTTRVRARLSQVGREGQYENFRSRQLMVACGAGVVGIFVGLSLTSSTFAGVLLASVSAFVAYFYIDRQLTRDVKKRLRTIESEFAPVVEMLTLAISAGETPIGSMFRIAERSNAILAQEFGKVVQEVRDGSPFSSALDAMGARSESVMIRRFVDALITALTRGAPLVDVLQRHALEARATQRNTLLSIAGKAEISMMIPVVFLILPISVLFALWPSVTNLNLFAS
jgi:tight adherence protein C